jgi:hypothetical protein
VTDPERLIASGSELERSLLLAGARQKPSAELVSRMERGLGFAPSLGVASASSSALGTKIVALVFGTVVAGGSALVLLYGRDASSIRAQPTASTVLALAARAEVETGSIAPLDLRLASLEEPSGSMESRLSERDVTDPTRVTSKRSSSSSVRSTDRLSEEVRHLDRVRAALNAGNSTLALQLVDRYHRRFPNGALAPEARKLRRSASERARW